MTTYMQMRKKHSDQIGAFPMRFAFSNTQLEDGLRSLGVADVSEVVSIGSGGFVKKDDFDAFMTMMSEQADELITLMKDKSFLVSAISYELDNHEYGYTRDPEPALDALGLTLDSDFKRECFVDAGGWL